MDREFKVHEIVQCSRLGKGDFRVIDTRPHMVRLEDMASKETDWIYTAHVTQTIKARMASARASRAIKATEVSKILDKPKRKH